MSISYKQLAEFVNGGSKKDILKLFWKREKQYAVLDKIVDNSIQNNDKLIALLSDALKHRDSSEFIIESLIAKISENQHNLKEGRKIANKIRAENASKKQITLEKATFDWLDNAKKEDRDTNNKSIVANLQKSNFRTQLKQANGKPYMDSTFKRDIELAAAKWRKNKKQKNNK